MKHYYRLLGYALPYKRNILLAGVFNLALVLFSLGSVSILMPVLKIIFENTTPVTEPPVYQGLTKMTTFVQAWLNYQIVSWIAVLGKQAVLFRVLAIGAFMFLMKNLVRYLGAINMAYINNNVERDLRNKIHKKLLQLPLGYFSEQRKGDLMTRLTADIVELQWALFSSIQRLVQDPLMILTTMIGLVVLSPQLTLYALILLPLAGLLITTIGNRLKAPSKKAKDELGKIMSYVEEHLSGLPVIRSFHAEDQMHQRFEQANGRYLHWMNHTQRLRELSSPMSEFLGSLVIIAIIWYSAKLILQDGALQPEVFITYIALFYQIINPAKSISMAIYDIKKGEASAERVFSIIDAQEELRPGANLPMSVFKDCIQFEHVSFSYQTNKVLDDIQFTLAKGKKIALVGQSGSGKSTIAKLLVRFYDPTSGNILVDGVPMHDLSSADWLKQLGYISQETFLLNDSVRNNLLMGNPLATDEAMWRALEVAHAVDFVNSLPGKLEASLGESGGKLSGGQRQRIGIARAVLKDPAILVLDEATSALDSESERTVQEALDALMAERTTLIIAHRLSTIQQADEILVLKEGKIIERGTHTSLLNLQGYYADLWRLQR